MKVRMCWAPCLACGGALASITAIPPAVAWAQADNVRPPGYELFVGPPILFGEGSGGAVMPIEGAFAYSFNDWFGVTTDVGIYVGEILGEKPLYTTLGGPVISFRSGRARLFVHWLVGAAYTGCVEFSDLSGCIGGWAPSGAFGGGAEVPFARRWSARAQADALLAGFRDDIQAFLRLSFGVVYRFGGE